MAILEVRNLKKVYGGKGVPATEALSNVNFSAEEGEFIAIMGESGSGKTTLLNMISTLDKPTQGTVSIAGKEINQLKDSEIAAFRRDELGFVFQDFSLLDSFSNRDNIYLPLVLSGRKPRELKSAIQKIINPLGIESFLDKFPYEISGGQKQRIAIARAIITQPKLLLADEPTGALDSSSADMIMKLFCDINRAGQTILMVTHSLKAAAFSNRVLFIKDGMVFHEIYRGELDHHQFMEKINNASIMLNSRETGGADCKGVDVNEK